jgi:hypothetical protein
MLPTTSCPKCSARVTLPDNTDPSAWVRCPLCSAEYQLHDALKYQPPVLQLIDAPGFEAENDIPTIGAVAAPSAAPDPFVAEAQMTAPLTNGMSAEATDVVAASAAGTIGEPIVAATSGDSDVITFDDSLLLEAATDEIPLEQPAEMEGARIGSAKSPIVDDDFFDVVSEQPAGAGDEKSGESSEWDDSNTFEPFELTEGKPQNVEDELRLEAKDETLVSPARAAAEQIGAPAIGLPPRRSARRGSPVLMFGGIVGGGVLGLAIGYAILMWGFKTDPLGFGPKLPTFMVPMALRAPATQTVARNSSATDTAADDFAKSGDGFPSLDTDQENPDPSAKAALDASTDAAANVSSNNGDSRRGPIDPFSNPPGETKGKDVADPLNADSLNADSLTSPTPGRSTQADGAPDLNIDPLAPSQPDARSAQRPTAGAAKDPLADPFADPSPPRETDQAAKNTASKGNSELPSDPFANRAAETKTGDSVDALAAPANTAAKESTPSALDSLGPLAEQTFSGDELLAAVERSKSSTRAALTLKPDADLNQKKSVNGAFYRDLSKVAEAFTFLESSQATPEHEKAATAALQAFLDAAPDSDRLKELGKLAGYWFANPQGKGIVLSGMVKSSKQQGKLVESAVETLGRPATITVVSPSALTDDPSRPILVAGAIVTDPAEKLRGYEGESPRVVWAAVAVDPEGSSAAPRRSVARPNTDEPAGDSPKADADESATSNK